MMALVIYGLLAVWAAMIICALFAVIRFRRPFSGGRPQGQSVDDTGLINLNETAPSSDHVKRPNPSSNRGRALEAAGISLASRTVQQHF